MKRLLLATLLANLGAANTTCAAEPRCESQTNEGHVSKLCVSQVPFQHDYYTLWVDGAPIFTLPDDYIESVTLTHHVPDDAAIEFPLSKQGMPIVTISGGCTPITEQQEINGKAISIEVGRSCSFTWGSVSVLKDLRVRF